MHQHNLELSVEELKGKQSVRATFRLPVQVIDLLAVIAGQLGIKQKSLFDQLLEDTVILGQVADEAKNYAVQEKDRRQKTFVISRSSLLALDLIARQQDIPRDILVEFSINRLLPFIASELKKHENRIRLSALMQDYQQQGEILLKKAEELLGKDDELYELIELQVKQGAKNAALLDGIIDRGRPLEDW